MAGGFLMFEIVFHLALLVAVALIGYRAGWLSGYRTGGNDARAIVREEMDNVADAWGFADTGEGQVYARGYENGLKDTLNAIDNRFRHEGRCQ
jgi:hypothetical protein